MMTKQALRKKYKAQRMALSLQQQHRLLAAMYEWFTSIALPAGCGMAMSYRAIAHNHEVPADIFESCLYDIFDELQMAYPRVIAETHHMEAYADDEALTWEKAAFNLYQPATGNIIPPQTIDLVLVPLLAFDTHGNRLGYGKGYYDRYLAQCRPDVLKIGLSWFEPEMQLPEIDRYDISLNYCVTPYQLYVF